MFDINRPRPFLRPAVPDARRAAVVPDRTWRALARIRSALDAQAVLHAEDRNDELVDVLLELQTLLTVPANPGRS